MLKIFEEYGGGFYPNRNNIRQTGIPPEEAVFVGHKAYELEGARAVGMKTIAFNYEQNAVADAYIDTFNELLEVSILKN